MANPFGIFDMHRSGPHTPAEVARARAAHAERKPSSAEKVPTILDVNLYLQSRAVNRPDILEHITQGNTLIVDRFFVPRVAEAKERKDEKETDKLRGLLRVATSPLNADHTQTQAVLEKAASIDERLTSPMWQRIHKVLNGEETGASLRPLIEEIERLYERGVAFIEQVPPWTKDAHLLHQRRIVQDRIATLRPIRNRLYRRLLNPDTAAVCIRHGWG